MAITKKEFVDKIEVLEDGQMQVRTATQFFEGGNPISEKSFNRKVITPGQDVSAEDELVRDTVAGNLHTPARVTLFNSKRGR